MYFESRRIKIWETKKERETRQFKKRKKKEQ
jgi:hypothetical protein